MSFNPHSLERLRELGRNLPKELPQPEYIKPHPKKAPELLDSKETPETLFKELINKSPDGEIEKHGLERLKEIETTLFSSKSNNKNTNKSTHKVDLNKNVSQSSSQTPNEENNNLYASFHMLLLEEED